MIVELEESSLAQLLLAYLLQQRRIELLDLLVHLLIVRFELLESLLLLDDLLLNPLLGLGVHGNLAYHYRLLVDAMALRIQLWLGRIPTAPPARSRRHRRRRSHGPLLFEEDEPIGIDHVLTVGKQVLDELESIEAEQLDELVLYVAVGLLSV